MYIFTAVDEWVLDRITQPIVDWLSCRFGVNQKALTGLLTQFYALSFTLWMVISFLSATSLFQWTVYGIFTPCYLRSTWKSIQQARQVLPKMPTSEGNPNRLRLFKARWLAFGVFVIDGGILASDGFSSNLFGLFAFFGYYVTLNVLSCSPPPARTQRTSRRLTIWST